MRMIKYDQVQGKIIEVRNQKVIIDSDVAELYGVETKRVNEAVKNNPDKFPDGYLIELDNEEKTQLVENFDRFNKLKHSTVTPKAFTEKGLYMLATILKSPIATETTLAIIDTYAKVRELGRVMNQVQSLPENSPKQKNLMEHTGELIADLIIPDDEMEVTGTETTFEVNLALFKIKRTVKKNKP
ncbi:MAG: DNA-binding protein [Legionella sp.]|nr:MAG: DNA-binding protein [Legionella sp.]PJD96162.1 MAG: DNA-binding protein [Legionella sp.]